MFEAPGKSQTTSIRRITNTPLYYAAGQLGQYMYKENLESKKNRLNCLGKPQNTRSRIKKETQIVRKKIKTQAVLGEINKRKNKFLQNVRRMDRSGLPHATTIYQPAEIRNPGRFLERFLNCCTVLPERTTRVRSSNSKAHDYIKK